jgi:hypothetical protein
MYIPTMQQATSHNIFNDALLTETEQEITPYYHYYHEQITQN